MHLCHGLRNIQRITKIILLNAETSDFNFLLNSEMILLNIHLSSSKEMFASVLNIESILEEYVS